ncbi:MAG: tetratricopeptide repeat protein, partial [Planctomycetota bacterium]
MSDHPSVQRAARLLHDILEDVCLDQLDAELDEEHPTDSDEFIADLTAGRLSAESLANFRQHLRGCLLCSDVIDNLREHYPLTELQEPEQEDLDGRMDAPAGTGVPRVQAVASVTPAVTPPPATLEQARVLLATVRPADPPMRAVKSGLQRTIAVLAAIAAVLVLVPFLRVLLQPGPLPSTFSTVATLSQFGLTSDVRGRDLTPDETELRKAETLRTELGQQPANPVARLNLAAQLLVNRQLEESRELIEAVLETRPQDPEVLNALALVQVASHEPQTAILTLQKAFAVKPLFAPAALNLADLLVEQNRSDEAVAVLRQALQRPLAAGVKEQLQ